MKHMILSSQMKEDVISDHILMLQFQKDSLDTVGFRTPGPPLPLHPKSPRESFWNHSIKKWSDHLTQM